MLYMSKRDPTSYFVHCDREGAMKSGRVWELVEQSLQPSAEERCNRTHCVSCAVEMSRSEMGVIGLCVEYVTV